MELREYLQVLYRWFWLVILGALAAMVSSYLVFRYYTPWPSYEATATLMIGDENLSLESVQAIRDTYAELAGRRPVSQAVVDALGLPMSAGDLEELIEVNPVGSTRLLEISVRYNDARQAATIANEIARQLSQVSLSGRRRPAQDTFARIITEAQVPARPNLDSYLGIFIAGVTGFSLATGVVTLIEYLGDKIRTAQDVERNLRLPVLGTVKQPSNARRDGLFRLLRRRREKSEIYQWICLRLCHLQDGSPQKLLITSPDVLEGQSTLAVGLATAWAETGQKVVLVNAHLRRPVVSQWLGFPNKGSSSASHEHNEYQRLQESEMAASMEGAKPPALLNIPSSSKSSTYLVSRQQYDALDSYMLDDLSRQANVVIVDAPPILSTPNAAMLVSRVDGILLVLGVGKTRIKATQETAKILEAVGGKVLGAVLLS